MRTTLLVLIWLLAGCASQPEVAAGIAQFVESPRQIQHDCARSFWRRSVRRVNGVQVQHYCSVLARTRAERTRAWH